MLATFASHLQRITFHEVFSKTALPHFGGAAKNSS
jgi:hypothetical protein